MVAILFVSQTYVNGNKSSSERRCIVLNLSFYCKDFGPRYGKRTLIFGYVYLNGLRIHCNSTWKMQLKGVQPACAKSSVIGCRLLIPFVYLGLLQNDFAEFHMLHNSHKPRRNDRIPCPPGRPVDLFERPQAVDSQTYFQPVNPADLAYLRVHLRTSSNRSFFPPGFVDGMEPLLDACLRSLNFDSVAIENAPFILEWLLNDYRRARRGQV